MGNLIFRNKIMKVLSSLAVMAGSQYGIEVAQVEQLLGGLIYGLIQKDDLKYIETCMTDSDKVVEEVNEAVTDIMKEDVEDIFNGIITDIDKSSSDIASGDYYTAGTAIADVVVL